MGFDPLRGFQPAASNARRAKMPAKKRAANDAAVIRATRTVGKATTKAAPKVARTVRRTVATTPRPAVDPLDAVLAQADRTRRTAKSRPAPNVETGGLNDLQRLLAAQGGGRPLLGRVIGNFGGDVVDTITGIPAAAQLGAENVAAAGLSPVALANEAGVPGTGFASGYLKRVANLDRRAAQATAADYAYRWGPLAKAARDPFFGLAPWSSKESKQAVRDQGSRLIEHPGFAAADLAAAYSVAGAAVRGGAGAAVRAGIAPKNGVFARIADRSIQPAGTVLKDGSVSTGARYRPPLVREVQIGENTDKGLKGRAVARVEVPQRPRSVNPITRSVQDALSKPVQRIAKNLEARSSLPDSHPMMQWRFGSQTKFNKRVAVEVRDFRLHHELAASKDLRIETGDLVKSMRRLDAVGARGFSKHGRPDWTPQQVDAALWLHAKDALDVPGMTPVQARDAVVKFMEDNHNAAVLRGGYKGSESTKTIKLLKSVPDILLDAKNGPVELRQAISDYRDVAQQATANRVKAGTITPETMNAPLAKMVHEGVVFDEKTGQWTSPRNPYSTVGNRAVYTPDIPVDKVRRGRAGDPSGAFARLTQDKIKQSHGTFVKSGNVNVSRGLPIRALERSLVDKHHPGYVQDFYNTFAFRRPNGKFSAGDRATMAMEADPENVILVSRKNLNDAMKRSRQLGEGELPDGILNEVPTYEGEAGLKAAKDALATMDSKAKKDLIAIPKAAMDAFRGGWGQIAGGPKKWIDTPTGLWKRGILAFAPRWYLNSLFGNTLQYGLATGFDLKALWQARRGKGIGEAVPERISGSTNVIEARMNDPMSLKAPRTKMGQRFMHTSDRLMAKQGGFDALFRRATYIAKTKKLLSDEGVKVRGLSPEALSEAIRTAPKEVVAQATREVELFLGDYIRMSPTERATLRRIFPFYSWMRVIGRLMMELPVRHPKRTAILALVAKASADVINPEDPTQSLLANRGRLKFGGNYVMRTTGANPFFTHADLIKAVAGGDPQAAAASLASNLNPIGLSQAARIYSGTNTFGAPVSAPPGQDGAASSFGGSLKRIDPVTNLPDYYTQHVPWSELALQTIPLVPQLLRGIAANGRTPYDTATTLDMLSGSKPDWQLYKPKADKGMEAIPGIGPFLSLAGTNVQKLDPAVERKKYLKAIADFKAAVAATERAKRKAQAKQRP